MSLAQGNNTKTQLRIEPGSSDSESDALTTRPVRSPLNFNETLTNYDINFEQPVPDLKNLNAILTLKQTHTSLTIPSTRTIKLKSINHAAIYKTVSWVAGVNKGTESHAC